MPDKETPLTMEQLKKDLLDVLNVKKEKILKSDVPIEYLYEIIDDEIPIPYDALLEIALDDLKHGNLGLATTEPRSLAFKRKNTAVNIIVRNIYDELVEIAMEWLNENTK